ncbi:coagulation factor X isoform X2 [Neoarius graeffei]|uniref:coagulation factor X isoform X2 n=1 Tax=Neoarius graeffei TaxID=443677 RepID=UPI00298C98D4|nr:coagulation factor X isoform X2 [Neoarius graeffei]
MFWVFRTFLCLLLVHCVTPDIFLHTKDANQVLTRPRRANTIFEEFKQGDVERECREERCDREEAREIFEDNKKTDEFWNVYFDGDSCISQPCQNKGVCKDGIGRYTCYCPELVQGHNCEIVIPQLCEDKNGGCEHFCKVDKSRGTAVCSCAKGYNLVDDGKSCTSYDPFKCGYVFPKPTRSILQHRPTGNITNTGNGTSPTLASVGIQETEGNTVNITAEKAATNSTQSHADTNSLFGLTEPGPTVLEDPVTGESHGHKRIVDGEDCPPGECPWQALLINEDRIGFCGGTILNEYFILSAAHCMKMSRSITVILGETDTLVRSGQEVEHAVEQHASPSTTLQSVCSCKKTTAW